mgnify:CR=1 FL=1
MTRSPLLESNITVCLSDSSLDGLEKKCARVKELYDDMNIIIERPLGDQLKLYMSFIPSVRILIKRFCNAAYAGYISFRYCGSDKRIRR